MPDKSKNEMFPELPDEASVLDYIGRTMVELLDASEKNAWEFYKRALFFYQRLLKDTISLDTLIARAISISEFLHETAVDKPHKDAMSPQQSMVGMKHMLRIDRETAQ